MGLDLALGALVLVTAIRGWLKGFCVQAIRLGGRGRCGLRGRAGARRVQGVRRRIPADDAARAGRPPALVGRGGRLLFRDRRGRQPRRLRLATTDLRDQRAEPRRPVRRDGARPDQGADRRVASSPPLEKYAQPHLHAAFLGGARRAGSSSRSPGTGTSVTTRRRGSGRPPRSSGSSITSRRWGSWRPPITTGGRRSRPDSEPASPASQLALARSAVSGVGNVEAAAELAPCHRRPAPPLPETAQGSSPLERSTDVDRSRRSGQTPPRPSPEATRPEEPRSGVSLHAGFGHGCRAPRAVAPVYLMPSSASSSRSGATGVARSTRRIGSRSCSTVRKVGCTRMTRSSPPSNGSTRTAATSRSWTA